MTIQQAARQAIAIQDACNASGLIITLAGEVKDAIWTHARATGTSFNTSPILTMFLLKISELNGCGCCLGPEYDAAEAACNELAASSVAVTA